MISGFVNDGPYTCSGYSIPAEDWNSVVVTLTSSGGSPCTYMALQDGWVFQVTLHETSGTIDIAAQGVGGGFLYGGPVGRGGSYDNETVGDSSQKECQVESGEGTVSILR